MIEFLTNNWQLLVAAGAVIAFAATLIYNFFKQPRSKQLEKIQEWLLFAVLQAERYFESGTGELKLRYVYDLFLNRFPAFAKFISFETFSKMVDVALERMRELLDRNEAIQNYID